MKIDRIRIELYKGLVIPKKKKGAMIFYISKESSPAKVKEIYNLYRKLSKTLDVTINGSLEFTQLFASEELYKLITIIFCNLITENNINPFIFYEGFSPECILELEKFRIEGHDLRDHFRRDKLTPIDILAEAPGILQNVPTPKGVH